MKKANSPSFRVAAALIACLCFFAPQAQAASSLVDNIGAATENALEKTVEYADDARITAQIKASYVAEKGLDSLDISVKTVDGVVVLSGVARKKEQASLAEKIAREAKGVKSVINKLTVIDK